MTKIFYHSCHSILEFDEVSLLSKLGYDVFSPGAYFNPNSSVDNMRPGIKNLIYDKDDVDLFSKIGKQHPGQDGKNFLTSDFIDRFDVFIVMHSPQWIVQNWDKIKHKRVIWRTIGQSVNSVEQTLQYCRNEGLEIIRYSPMEQNIPGYIGHDTIIRFYKDPDQYKNWSGEQERVISFVQDMKNRHRACNYYFFEEVTRPFNRHLFGPGNQNIGDWTTGKIPYDKLLQELRRNRIYFYTGTHPASYTLNFMEAWMTGIPIVAIGPQHGNARYFPGHNLYEIPNLIENETNGFISDNKTELQQYITELISNESFAKQISQAGRDSAIKYFGEDAIVKQWNNYIG